MTFLYIFAVAFVCLGSVYKLTLVFLYYKNLRCVSPPPLPQGNELPFVTIQLPLYNEKFVAERLIRAIASFDYPKDRYEIQVLDDSTDETTPIVQALAQEISLLHLTRDKRTDFKAGALANGLTQARGELIAIFDADFVPAPDFLKKTVPYFRDHRVGVVQAKWAFLNVSSSLLTRLQALYLNAHFTLEHTARSRAGGFFHFNGSAGVWRRKAIEDAGGWRGMTLTEDLDLSYRAHLKGWRFVFLNRLEVPSELPASIPALQAQQFRWAKGMTQVARLLLPTIWRSEVSFWKKADATLHLLSPVTYLSTLIAALTIIPYLLFRDVGPVSVLEAQLATILLGNLSWSFAYYAIAERENGTLSPRRLIDLSLGIPLGIALSVNGTRALLSGLLKNGGTFERTPKQGDSRPKKKKYEALSPLTLPWEFLFAVCFLVAFTLTPLSRAREVWPLLLLFGSGFWYLSLGAVQRIYLRTLQRAR